MNSLLPYYLDILRVTDRDRYMSVLFAPKKARKALAALYSFNAEMVRIRENMRDPRFGEVRLHLWRDSITESETENKISNPILEDLLTAITVCNLPKEDFLHYCDTRSFDLYGDAMETIHDLEVYCTRTESTILRLACQILDHDKTQNIEKACRHGGIAQGLGRILCLLPLTQNRYQRYLPSDMLRSIGVDRRDLESECISDEQKKHIVEAMVALARDHYLRFYECSITFPKTLKPVFLPLAIMPAFFQKVLQLGIRIFQEEVSLSTLYRHWLITKTALRGHFPKL